MSKVQSIPGSAKREGYPMGPLEEIIRQIVVDELSKHQPKELQSISEFCKAKNITRVTMWRAEKEGRIKLTRIGRKVFVDTSQFFVEILNKKSRSK